MEQVTVIHAFEDNYVYLCEYDAGLAFVIDPGDSAAVLGVLKDRQLKLTHILVTHNHFDHTAGVQDIVGKTAASVVASGAIADDLGVEVIRTPGHTADSVCYCWQGAVFTGDTMFISGCGRLFGNDAAAMFDSLQRIAALPDETLVYPGHDYTRGNYDFALTVEPSNEVTKEQLLKLEQGQTILPSTIKLEKQSNPFLRAGNAVRFVELRKLKDVF